MHTPCIRDEIFSALDLGKTMNEWLIHSSIDPVYIRSVVCQIGQITLKPHEADVFVVNQV